MRTLTETLMDGLVLGATPEFETIGWELLLAGDVVARGQSERRKGARMDPGYGEQRAVNEACCNQVECGCEEYHRTHTGSSEGTSPMSDNGRSDALGLLVEVRDSVRVMVNADYMTYRIERLLVMHLRRLDNAIDLLTEEA